MVFNNVHGNIELMKKVKKDQKTRKVLLIICTFLIIATITLTVCYIKYTKQHPRAAKLCETDLCIRSAATLRLAMNTSVDPCDDFYNFACGLWTDEHPDHGWFSPLSAWTMIEETISAAVLKFLQTNASKTEPLPVTQSRDLYASCMNQAATDELGFRPIYKYLSLLGLPTVPTFMNLTDFKYAKTNPLNWVRTEALATRLLGMQSFIGFSVDSNMTNNSHHVISLSAPPLMAHTLPWVHTFSRSFLNQLKHQLKKIIRHSIKNEYDESDSDKFEPYNENAIFVITYSVVAVHYLATEELPDNFTDIVNSTSAAILKMNDELNQLFLIAQRPDNCTDSKECEIEDGITVNELQTKTNEILQQFNLTPIEIWKPYLLQVFEGLNVTLNFNKNEILNVDQYDVLYLVTVVRYLSELPDELIELWLWSKTVIRLILNTSSKIKSVFTDLSDIPRHLECVRIVDGYMGMAVSYAIADKILLNDTRQRVEEMILDIKTAFTKRLKTIKWMDKKTKRLTFEKCNAMLSFVGYPDWLMKEGALEKFYSNITIRNNTYLDNLLSITQKNINRDLQKLYAGHDKVWPADTDPITINAFHRTWENSIIVPMAFLFFPLYNLGLEVLNYAATGSTLGHELIHGFDDNGREYDKNGNNVQWWDDEVIEKFEDLAECFVKQYSAFYVPEVAKYVDGTVSLGENIADNDGLRLAYMAYKYYNKRNKEEYKLPGLEQYTHDQMFFIAYASTWCDETERDNSRYTEEEPHAPKMIRLIGSLQNSKEFVKAFHCSKGSKMNPNVPKCSIW